jgi:hypothetical protein
MKLTIWQQFSSNHSSHFHIVGVFDTSAAAQKAADELRQIFKQIEDWHEQNPEKSEALMERWSRGEWPQAVSEIEEILAEKYGVRWTNGIEWFWDARLELLLDHIVHISTGGQTDSGPEPFDEIIERLGGYGLVTGADVGGTPFGKIIVYLSCVAPDIETAEMIVKEQTKDSNNKFKQTLKHTNKVSNSGTALNFSWDFDSSFWKLDRLVKELKDNKCTDIGYSFFGTRNMYTNHYKLDDKK